MSRGIAFASFALSILVLAWGVWTGGFPAAAAALVVLGMVWGGAQWRGWKGIVDASMFVMVLVAGMATLAGLPAVWTLLSVVAALVAWDLDDFSRRLRLADPEDDLVGLERRHLAALGSVTLVGLVLGLSALSVRLQIDFWPAVLLVGVAGGIIQLVRWLLRTEGVIDDR